MKTQQNNDKNAIYGTIDAYNLTSGFYVSSYTFVFSLLFSFTRWTTYVIHPGVFLYRKLYNGGNVSTFWQNKTYFHTILTTNLYDKSQTKVPYGTIYTDNIQKAVVICLIIPTIFSFDAGSSIKKYPDVWRTLSTLV